MLRSVLLRSPPWPARGLARLAHPLLPLPHAVPHAIGQAARLAPASERTFLLLLPQRASRAIHRHRQAGPAVPQPYRPAGARRWARYGSTAPPQNPPERPAGFGERLRRMFREYGWTAIGVYLALSVLDFPLCFMLVKVVGTEKIGQAEHWVASFIPQSVKEIWANAVSWVRRMGEKHDGNGDVADKVEMAGWGVEQAQAANNAQASLATELALAYAVHKSFIFLRVPLTAAVLPKVVKILRSWGWNIGKRTLKTKK